MTGLGTFETSIDVRYTAASLSGRLVSSAFRRSVDLMWDVTRRSSLLFGIGTWALP